MKLPDILDKGVEMVGKVYRLAIVPSNNNKNYHIMALENDTGNPKAIIEYPIAKIFKSKDLYLTKIEIYKLLADEIKKGGTKMLKYFDRVRVINGFYEGCEGTVNSFNDETKTYGVEIVLKNGKMVDLRTRLFKEEELEKIENIK